MRSAHRFMATSGFSELPFSRCLGALLHGMRKTLKRVAPALVVALACTFGAHHATAAPLLKDLGGSSGFGTFAMGRNDDGSSGGIPLGSGFPYGLKLFSGRYTSAYINNNGNITFQSALGTFTPTPFPITNLPMLAPFWGDVDTRGGAADPARNNVYYSTAIPGKLVITWNYVGYYAGATNKLNAFQLVLTDRSEVAQGDFDIEYRYEQLQWTTGSASGGSNGLGGTPAQMGYDAGDGKNFFRHPDSGTAGILNLVTTSNVDEPGVWRFEVRGGTPNPVKTPNLVNVRLIETLNASDIAVDPTSFQTQPQNVTSANGQTVIEWDFAAFPANITKDLSFDVIFKNPVAGERRQLVSKLELLYNDVNGNPVRTELGPESINVYPSIYQVTPTSNRASYGPNESVLIGTLVKNLSGFAGSTSVRLSIVDSANAPVASLGTTPVQTVDAGATRTFDGLQFSTGTKFTGSYRIVAELLDSSGKVIAAGSSAFSIVGAASQNAQASIATDKQVYNPFETVRLSDRVLNQMVNANLNDLRIQTSVRNPDGTVRVSNNESLLQLAPGGFKDFSYAIQLGWAAIGRYTATLTITQADGTVLAQVSTAFSVASSADTGAGLTGMIVAAPAVANTGQPVALTFSATNNGNAVLPSLPLTVSILDPQPEQVVASYPRATTALAVGGHYVGTADWTAIDNATGYYVAVLSATVGGKTLTLAQMPLRVLKLDLTQVRAAGRPVLALVSCLDGEYGKAGSTCLTERARAIDQALTAAGVAHTIATDETAFRKAFRSGLYSTYWISGKQDKLHDQLAGEVREAVFGGDGAIIDSEHDQRNGILDAMAGVRWKGKFGALDLGVELDGALFPAQHLGTTGRSGRMLLDGGARQAGFGAGDTDEVAIVSNGFGAGRVIQFAFDLPASLRTYGAWQAPLEASLKHVQAQPGDTITPGAVVPVRIVVADPGLATRVAIASVLPAGTVYLNSTPDGRYDAQQNALAWTASLETTQSWDGALNFRAPAATGQFTLQTVVSTLDATTDAPTPYGAPLVLPLKVVGAAQNAAQVVAALNGYAPLGKPKAKLRDDLVEQVNGALAAFNANTVAGYDAAIVQLIGAVNQLGGLGTVNTRPVRDGIDRMVREAQWRWSQLAPPN